MKTRQSRWIAAVGMLAVSVAGCSGEMGGDYDETAGDGGADDEHVTTVEQEAITGTLVNPTPIYSGIWSSSGAASETLRFNRTAAQLASDNTTLAASGNRITSLTANVVSGAVRYSAIWNPGTVTQVLKTDLTKTQFDTEYASLWFLGYRLSSLATHNVGGTLYVSAVWNASLAGEIFAIGRTQTELVNDNNAQALLGNQLMHLTATVVGTQTLYSGIWRPSLLASQFRTGQTLSAFNTEKSAQATAGRKLSSLAVTGVDGVAYYHSVFVPSTATQVVVQPFAEPAFGTQNTSQRSAGRRLTQLVANVESLNLTDMANRIRDTLTPAAAGFATTLAVGTTRERRVGGFRRTATDAPQRASTNTASMNLASVSKTITAAAAQRALADNTGANTTLDSPMRFFLPASWTRGPNVDTITFRELLTHRSGFRNANANLMGYADLRTMVANGITLANKSSFSYQNQNFALFRILIPYLTGYTGTGDIDAETSTRFLSYVNTKIITAAGAGTGTALPPASEPTLYYTMPAGTVPGTAWGDWSRTTGGGGLHLSSDQLATVLVQRYDAAVLGGTLALEQDNGLLGWQRADAVRHGTSRFHGGYLFRPTPSNGNQEVNTLAVSICQAAVPTPTTCVNGVHVGLLTNSRVTTDQLAAVNNAYTASWMTTY